MDYCFREAFEVHLSAINIFHLAAKSFIIVSKQYLLRHPDASDRKEHAHIMILAGQAIKFICLLTRKFCSVHCNQVLQFMFNVEEN